jgi:hypothetical protein
MSVTATATAALQKNFKHIKFRVRLKSSNLFYILVTTKKACKSTGLRVRSYGRLKSLQYAGDLRLEKHGKIEQNWIIQQYRHLRLMLKITSF